MTFRAHRASEDEKIDIITQDEPRSPAGAYWYVGNSIMMLLPCGDLAHLDGWTITGEDDSLTISPSIQCYGTGRVSHLHGFIREGKWVPANG